MRSALAIAVSEGLTAPMCWEEAGIHNIQVVEFIRPCNLRRERKSWGRFEAASAGLMSGAGDGILLFRYLVLGSVRVA